MAKEHTPEEIKYRLSDLGVQIGNIAIEYITDLESQIEKMKCCWNCKHSRTEYEHCRTDKHEKWEIKEK